MWSEFGHSMVTGAILASKGTGVARGKLHGVLPIYMSVAGYGWLYFCASLRAMAVGHDAYFYGCIAQCTSDTGCGAACDASSSRYPTRWAAYSFDPGEALVHAVFMPVAWSPCTSCP
jgi:Delta7-sterol 5-desaturase